MGSMNENHISLPGLVLYSSRTALAYKRYIKDEGYGGKGRKGVGVDQASSPAIPHPSLPRTFHGSIR